MPHPTALLQYPRQDKKTGTSNTPLNGSTGMILHRGLSLEAPENTLPAFNLAG